MVTTAHQLGIRSSCTMMYGHVDHPRQWLGHFRVLAGIQDVTGGFTEFVALPFVHTNAPIYLAGIARPGPTWRENRVVHAMARLLLHGRIDNIQCSWVKLGDEGTRAMLNGGCNDLGRHADGGDHLPDGRFRARFRPYGGSAAATRRVGGTPGAGANHDVWTALTYSVASYANVGIRSRQGSVTNGQSGRDAPIRRYLPVCSIDRAGAGPRGGGSRGGGAPEHVDGSSVSLPDASGEQP